MGRLESKRERLGSKKEKWESRRGSLGNMREKWGSSWEM